MFILFLFQAADTITAALKGHQSRQQRIHKFQYYDESETEDESITDATELIYSSLKGHNNRKDKMKRMRYVDSCYTISFLFGQSTGFLFTKKIQFKFHDYTDT